MRVSVLPRELTNSETGTESATQFDLDRIDNRLAGGTPAGRNQ
jgi:hypothetical protein